MLAECNFQATWYSKPFLFPKDPRCFPVCVDINKNVIFVVCSIDLYISSDFDFWVGSPWSSVICVWLCFRCKYRLNKENLTVPADTHLADSHFLIYTRLRFDLQGCVGSFGGFYICKSNCYCRCVGLHKMLLDVDSNVCQIVFPPKAQHGRSPLKYDGWKTAVILLEIWQHFQARSVLFQVG